ncbi:helix-turn-helix transcriptional regulator [Intrasporangium sp.]|uniref:helix-turn-helix transcriptional regulator n=1 Tax=Intrasporangium sp. TaxID=1925024 RepID=UPI0029396643|nr:helix-turn-helix transcriptional regulator [Intrasporangium sp.]MDV3222637.1 helix-turn-helix transcriptional regulator [Intrasporangium sp.]
MDERDRWLAAAAEILHAPTSDAAHDLFVTALMRDARAELATRVSLQPEAPEVIAISVDGVRPVPPTELWPEAADARRHPLNRYVADTGDTSPVRLVDVIRAGWELDSQGYEAMEALGITLHQLTLPVSPRGGAYDGWVVLNEDGFDDEVHGRFTRLQAFLTGLDRHVRLLAAHECWTAGLAAAADAPRLTPRERVILGLMESGSTADSIAGRLAISPRTVHKHQENLYRKLGACDRLSAVLRAQRLGLLHTPVDDATPTALTAPSAPTAWSGRAVVRTGRPGRQTPEEGRPPG